MKKPYAGKLFLSIFIDILGFLIGGLLDFVWAPISAIIVQSMYHNKAITTIQAIEEILPFTDIIPTATIGWFVERFK